MKNTNKLAALILTVLMLASSNVAYADTYASKPASPNISKPAMEEQPQAEATPTPEVSEEPVPTEETVKAQPQAEATPAPEVTQEPAPTEQAVEAQAEPNATPAPEVSEEPAPTEQAVEEQPAEASVTTGSENGVATIHAAASTDSEIIGQLSRNDRVTVLGVEGGWTKIRANGLVGYVLSKSLQAVAPGAKLAPEETVAPEITPVPEETIAPEATPVPEETIAPEATPVPEETIAPEATPVPEGTAAPEVTPVPEETIAPEITPVPEETIAPEITPVPEETIAPEITPVPEETIAPEETAPAPFVSQYQRNEQGELILDGQGNPIPLTPLDGALYQRDASGNLILDENGEPILVEIQPSPAEERSDLSQAVIKTWMDAGENTRYGDTVTIFYEIQNFYGWSYTVQWQRKGADGWVDVPGATGEAYRFTLTEDNLNTEWRVRVDVAVPEASAGAAA